MRFPKHSSQIDFPAMEEAVLARWKERRAFERSVSERPIDKPYSFYDGPPFATGLPHYGHLLVGTIKDVVARYRTMAGYRVERRFGWDCHGLPVEFEIERELGLKGRHEVEAYGVGKFNEACRSIVLRYTSEWREIVTRMGRWVDFDNEYRTMDVSFMESVWTVFKRLYDKGLIYEGYRVVPYSWRIGAPLSNFEANLDYREVQDPSITVRFSLEDGQTLLAWTTTPWTLPSNLGLAVDPERDYVRVKVLENDESVILLAEAAARYWPGGEGIETLATFKGAELVGKRYTPLFPFFVEEAGENAFQVMAADFVEAETGTGVVHMAPAFGEDDFHLCRKHGIDPIDPVDEDGRFTDAVPDFAGLQVKEADPKIIKALKAQGRVLRHETLVHSYPFCYRSETPLIYKTISAWYVAVEQIKEQLIANNQKVHWVPGHLRDGRFGKWLENARDWNISRNRFWGNPIPIWRNSETGEVVCVGSKAELEELSGQSLDDLHKHVVDEVAIPSPSGQGELRRVPEVLDCWFESGSMPYGQAHYPFENTERFEAGFPADFIAEGLDQTRGWFYTLMVLSTALFDEPAYQNVVVNGLVLAEDGRKMSKRLKNYPEPTKLIESHGADAIRIYMMDSGAVRGEELRFTEKGVRDMVRRVLLPWWNAVCFLGTYAHVDGWDPQTDRIEGLPTAHLDVWVLSKLERLRAQVDEQMADYELSRVVPPLLSFLDDLTNWYIRRSRRRFWKSESDADKKQAYSTLYQVLLEFTELMAPFTPFMAEHVYEILRLTETTEAIDSVHLCLFPEADKAILVLDHVQEIERKIDLARTVSELGRELRAGARLKTRQPLGKVTVGSTSAEDRAALEQARDIILDELNIKELAVVDDPTSLAAISIKPNKPRLGPRLGKQMGPLMKALATLPEADAKRLAMGESVEVAGIELGPEDVLVHMEAAESGFLVAARQSLVVSIDPTITDALRREGLARELINRIQRMRKDHDLAVDDRIEIGLRAAEPAFQAELEAHVTLVESETLGAVSFEQMPDTIGLSAEHDVDGHAVTIAIARRAQS